MTNQDYGGRVVFEYTLADASGNVLTSGQVQMSPSIKDVGVIYGTASGASFGDEIICNSTFSIDGYSTSETVNTTVV